MLAVTCGALGAAYDPLEHLDLHIGTGGDGFGVGGSPPGAQVPFGVVRASPDTSDAEGNAPEWSHYGGYHYHDTTILGFSHTHMVGSGVQDWGNIRLMPGAAEPTLAGVTRRLYRAGFRHEDEVAAAGKYSVLLGSGVRVEVAACGTIAAAHRYRWGSRFSPRVVLVDAASSLPAGRVANSSISWGSALGDGVSFRGWAVMKGALTERNGAGVRIWFEGRVAGAEVSGVGTWVEAVSLRPGSRAAAGAGVGGWVRLAPGAAAVEVLVALSFVSAEQAGANLAEAAAAGGTVDECASRAAALWRSALSAVTVEVMEPEPRWARSELTKLYTGLYHALMAPSTYSEGPTGLYRGLDGAVHTMRRHHYLSDLSIWDIFRSQAPLLALLQPEAAASLGASLLAMKADGGDLPRWPIASVFSGCMVGAHATQILLDYVVKGVPGVGASEALAATLPAALGPRKHGGREALPDYEALGYVPSNASGRSASLTLAYAYDDWAVSELARAAGDSSTATTLAARSQRASFALWSPERRLMCPRTAEGALQCPRDPHLHTWLLHDAGYVEGNAAEWSWFVPHDVPGLIDRYPPGAFAERLDDFFRGTLRDNSTLLPNPYYWAGNEPDILVPIQFAFANRTDLFGYWTRWVAENKYTSAPDGMPGNDDFGALSAWLVWAMLGMYPHVGTSRYALGAPVFPNVTLDLGGGRVLAIVAHGAGPGAVFPSRAELNGRTVDLTSGGWMEHGELAGGKSSLEVWLDTDG